MEDSVVGCIPYRHLRGIDRCNRVVEQNDPTDDIQTLPVGAVDHDVEVIGTVRSTDFVGNGIIGVVPNEPRLILQVDHQGVQLGLHRHFDELIESVSYGVTGHVNCARREGLQLDGHLTLTTLPHEGRGGPGGPLHSDAPLFGAADLEFALLIRHRRCRSGLHERSLDARSVAVDHATTQHPCPEHDVDIALRRFADRDGSGKVAWSAHLEDRRRAGPLELDLPVLGRGADLFAVYVDHGARNWGTEVIECPQLIGSGLPEQ